MSIKPLQSGSKNKNEAGDDDEQQKLTNKPKPFTFGKDSTLSVYGQGGGGAQSLVLAHQMPQGSAATSPSPFMDR